jgi:outer membrane protease
MMAFAAAWMPVAVARADEPTADLGRPGFEVGGRYWYSIGRIGYNYYGDTTTSLLVSRLTYDQLTANAGELYFRGDTSWGLFLKGFIGAGAVGSGRLTDEDFPPLTVPYSATTSAADGSLSYGTIDLGYSLLQQPTYRLGAFVGYGRWNESITASGCTQTAGNPDICQPVPIPTSIEVINETDHWNLVRLGLSSDVLLGERFKLTLDAAYVRAWQQAVDNHFFTFGVDPSSGTGNGFQLDAIASYQFTNAFSLGIGGRFWRLDTSAIDSFQQLESYSTDRYGVFAQGSYKLN